MNILLTVLLFTSFQLTDKNGSAPPLLEYHFSSFTDIVFTK